MADDLNTEIKIGADASGVEAGVGRAKRSLKDLGESAKKAGQDAGAGIGAIGAGGDKAAKDVERATKSMQGSLQRLLAEQVAGAKGSREYYEALADTRGISRNAIKPILDQIDAAKSKTLQAKTAADSWTASLGKVGPLVAAAFSGAAITGFLGQVVSVQREFDVLNSSLKTVTGSSAAAEREMAWLKDFAKETPFGLAQATQGFVKMKALGLDPTRAALTSFGNTASAMGKDLNQMIEAVADASTGEFERLKEFGIKAKKEGDNVSLTFQGVTTTIGNSAREITKYLEDIGNTSFGGAMEERAKTLDGTIAALGDTWDELFRTVSTNNVGSLIFDSVTLANGALEDATTLLRAMGGAAQDASRDTGALSTIQNGIATVFETVAVLGANLKYILVQIGNEIGGLAAQVAQAAQFNFSGVAAIRSQMVADAEAARREIDATTERILRARKAQEEYARYATRNASAATDPRRVDLGGSTARATGSASSGAAKAVKETISEYDKLIKKLSEELPKAAADAEAAQMGYNKAQTEFLALAGSEVWAKFTNSQRATVAALFENKIASEQSALAAKTLAKANLDAAASREKYLTSLSAGLDKIQADIAAQIEATERMGLSKEAIAELDAAKLEMLATDLELQAIKAMDRNLDQQTYDALKKQAAAYRELGIAKKGGAAKEAALDMEKANAEAAKKAQEDWKRAADDINNSLTDALLRGFESGKDFAKNLRDTVVNMFKTMVLRPIISAVVNPVAGALTGALGFAGTASAATGAASGLSTIGTAASGLSLATGLFGSGVKAGFGALFGEAGISGALSASTTAIGAGNIAGGLGTAIGALGPIVLGIGVLASGLKRTLKDVGIQGSLGGAEGFTGQQYKFYEGGFLRSDKTTTEALDPAVQRSLASAFQGIQNQISGFATALKLPTDQIKAFTTEIKFSTSGLDEAGVQKVIGEALATGSNELAQQIIGTWTTATSDITQVIETGITESLGTTFETIQRTVTESTYTASEFARENEKAIDTLSRLATSITTVNGTFETLGLALFDVSLAGADAASQLIDATGGIEAFSQKFGAYYDAFYSEEEKRANVIAGITRTLRDAGAQVTEADVAGATREQFRSIYESIVAVSGAADPVAVAMINVAGAFASVTQASEAARVAETQRAQEIRRSAQQIVDAQKRGLETLQSQLAQTQLQTRGGSIGGLILSPVEVQSFSGFSDALSSATQALDQLSKLGLADELSAYAAEVERVISSTRQLLAEDVAKSRIRSGDVYGAIAVKSQASPLDYSMFGGQDGFNAGAFNAALAKQRAQVAAGLISYVSENALRVVDAGSSLGVLNSQVLEFERSLFQTTLQGFSSIVGGAATSALEEVARVLSSREAQKMIGGSIGLSRIMAASSAYAEASQTAFVGSRQVMGASAIAYATAIAELDRLLSTGRITVDQYQKSLGIVHDSVGDLSEQVLNLSGQMAAAAGAAGRLSEAGIEGVAYYFSDLSAIVGEMAQAAKEAATPLAQASESIGLLNSAAAAFGGSANAAINGANSAMAGYLDAAAQARSDQLFNNIGGYEDAAALWRASLAEMQRPGSQVSRAQLVAESASIASSILTTASAASAAEKLAENLTLGQGQSLRDLSLLVDGVGQYDNQAFYASFLRISDALGKGVIDEGQYQSLFEYMTESYQGVDQEAQALVSSMQSLRDAMRGFADQLLIDQQRTTLSPGAALEEMQRQYAQAFAGAATGDAQAISKFQGLASTLLDKELYATQAEYNAAFGSVYGDARRLEDIGINTLANAQGNEMVSELKDMNAKLNKRVEDLEKNLMAALAQIAKNTSDTSRGIEQQIVMAEDTP